MDILIDADVVAYQVCSNVIQWIDFGEDNWVNTFNKAELLDKFEGRIKRIQSLVREHTKKKKVNTVLCWTDPSGRTWRHGLYAPYKANRKGKPKPPGFPIVRDWSRDVWGFEMRGGLEADDVLGIRGSQPRRATVVVTIDKDLRQIPGLHLNPDSEEFFEVTEAEGRLWHMTQTLTGDMTDNYPGCPGVGPVKAARLLGGLSPGEHWPAIVEAYAAAGRTEEEALVQARISHILTHKHFDRTTKTPILWTPKDYA